VQVQGGCSGEVVGVVASCRPAAPAVHHPFTMAPPTPPAPSRWAAWEL
jgi:hypothetical protein